MTDMKKIEVLRSFGFERQDAEALINQTEDRIEFGDFVAENEDGHVVVRELVYDGPRDPRVELDEHGYEITIIPSATAYPVAVLL